MAVRIRLKRIGRKNRPYYRVCVFDARTRRDGAPIEEIGSYNPHLKAFEEKIVLDRARALHWLDRGAQPSDTVASILKRSGVKRGQPLPEVVAPAPVAGEAG